MQNLETNLNSVIDCLENLVNNMAIKNVSQSVKDRIQAITNRLSGNDISKTFAKISNILEKLATPQERTQNTTTINEQATEMNPPQKLTYVKAVTGKKIITHIPTAQEPPSLRHHLRRVIVIMEEKHTQTPANRIVNNINMQLQELEASFKVQSASWTDARNLVLIVPTPDDAANMVVEFEKWAMSLPVKASHAQLDTKTHQVVIQCAYI